MTHLDAAQQQQIMMMNGVDPMMMYGMDAEGEGEEDGWLAPDSAFLNQQIQFGGQGDGPQWMQGFAGFEGDEDDEGYGDDFEDAPSGNSPKKASSGGIMEIPPFNPTSAGKKKKQAEVRTEGTLPPSAANDGGDGQLNASFEDEISDASIEIGASDEEEDDDGF